MDETEPENLVPTGHLPSAIIATAVFIVVFSSVALPPPLYTYYQQTIGISDTEVSLTNVTYLLGVLAVLFFAGSLSDAVGRRPVAAAALVVSMAGNALFLTLSSGLMLQLARMLQGASVALCMSAVAAYVIDAAGERYRTLGVTISSCGSLLGLSAGSIVSGLLGGVLDSYDVLYWLFIALAAAALALLVPARETVARPVPLRAALRPIVRVPRSVRAVLPAAGGLYVCLWGAGMFFQSLSAPVCLQYFGIEGSLVPALFAIGAFAPSAVGGSIVARVSTRRAFMLCLASYVLSCAGVCACLQLGLLVPCLLFDALFGASVGVGLSLAMKLLVDAAEPGENATVVSLVNFIGYIGATTASAIMTGLTTVMPLMPVFAVAAALCAFAFAPGLRFVREG